MPRILPLRFPGLALPKRGKLGDLNLSGLSRS
jgi:hypothetical protein